ncbi:MAG: hypothetical protein EZS28_007500 [Streblomastix strix]|uniref:Right handed beta helix domain-containing protein n=1 Tax=Streblomastix strix TaxID=222440 RepID=A0A5J4WQZ4_9EUKA|nr:MAG: hypothetical protein EZS28_007500 [Streblomastix strix]
MIIAVLLVVTFVVCKNLTPQNSQSISNAPCTFNVGKNQTYETIGAALAVTCNDGYIITLVDEKYTSPLNLVSASTKLFQGRNDQKTKWELTSSNLGILLQQRAVVTLINLIFCFNSSGSNYYPTQYLIQVGDQTTPYPSLTVDYCDFKSVARSATIQNNIFIIHINNANTISLDHCNFYGANSTGSNDPKMFGCERFSRLTLKYCTFQNGNFTYTYPAIFINSSIYNAVIQIKSCQFLESFIGADSQFGIFYLVCNNRTTTTLVGNTFLNSISFGNKGDILTIVDNTTSGENKFIISSNIFQYNQGKQSGGIIIDSRNPESIFDFTYNIFYSNTKTDTAYPAARNAFLQWQSIPTDWNVSNIETKITQLFQCSETNADSPSVYYIVKNDSNTIKSGSIRIPFWLDTQSGCNEDCGNIVSNTSVIICPCPEDPALLQNDPRYGDLCPNPCNNINPFTSTMTCPCPEDPTLLQNDPRKGGLCPYPCNNINSSTSIAVCPCETVPAKQKDDPRKGGLCPDPCSKANLKIDTATDICPCPTNPTDLGNDIRKDGICSSDKCGAITSTTPIETCECPKAQSDFDKDPRATGLCKCKVIFGTTPNGTCPCPTDPTDLKNDPRANGLCKCAIITSTTTDETCKCPTNQTELANDPRKDGICKATIVTPGDEDPTETKPGDIDPGKKDDDDDDDDDSKGWRKILQYVVYGVSAVMVITALIVLITLFLYIKCYRRKETVIYTKPQGIEMNNW